jgi:hypothetical protein
MDRGLLEVLPLTHIRGRSLHDAFVIVDEAQSLERNVLLTVLSRIGQNSKVVLTTTWPSATTCGSAVTTASRPSSRSSRSPPVPHFPPRAVSAPSRPSYRPARSPRCDLSHRWHEYDGRSPEHSGSGILCAGPLARTPETPLDGGPV